MSSSSILQAHFSPLFSILKMRIRFSSQKALKINAVFLSSTRNVSYRSLSMYYYIHHIDVCQWLFQKCRTNALPSCQVVSIFFAPVPHGIKNRLQTLSRFCQGISALSICCRSQPMQSQAGQTGKLWAVNLLPKKQPPEVWM